MKLRRRLDQNQETLEPQNVGVTILMFIVLEARRTSVVVLS